MNNVYGYVERYLEEHRRRRYREGTVKGYEIQLKKLIMYMEEEGKRDLRGIGREEAEGFLEYVKGYRNREGKGWSREYQRGIVNVVRRMFEYMEEEGELVRNPMRGIEKIRGEERLPREVLSRGEVEELLRRPDVRKYRGYRDKVIMECMYCTGIRNGEVRRLEVRDIDLGKRVMYVREGKGGKGRVVPLGERISFYIGEYVRKVRGYFERGRGEEYLFLSMQGRGLSDESIRRIVKKYSEGVGGGKRITPHVLRHSFATHMLEGGADVYYISKILGHKRVATTCVYTHVVARTLMKNYYLYHPRAYKRGGEEKIDKMGEEE